MYRYFAVAKISGGELYPDIYGEVQFNQLRDVVEITANIFNLPPFMRGDGPAVSPFGFHIHDGGSCAYGTGEMPFPETGLHYNPDGRPHGDHAGDMPSLFPTKTGRVYMSFIDDRFTVGEIIGKTVVIHQSPDDYITQPAGGSGTKIACGVIV